MKKVLLSPIFIILLLIIIGGGGAIAALYIGAGSGTGTTSIDLQKGLVGNWKFDNNAKDSTPNSNHGTVTGATLTTDRKGQVNKAYNFGGTTDYIDMGSNQNLGLSGDSSFSIGLWAKPSATRNDGSFVSYGSAGTGRVISINANGTGKIYSVHYSNDHAFSTSWQLDQWQYVVIAYDPATSIEKLYVNGVYQEEWAPTDLSLATTDKLRIGRATWNDIYVNTTLIDDVRIYNRALSAAEITALYESYNPGVVVSDLQKGLVAQWKMDGTAKNATPNSLHGAVTGATLTTDRKGQTNKAYSFNGTSDWINIPDLNLAGDFSITAWVKLTGSGSNTDAIVGQEGTGQDINFYGGFLRLYAPNDVIVANTAAVAGAWTQYVITRSGTSLVLYYNGTQDATGTWSGSFTPKAIGRGNAGFINGSIDDVRIYNRAITATEVTALYESYDPGIVVSDLQKGLVGQWKFDNNAKDSTPNSNHGTVTGATLTTDRKGQTNKAYSFNGTGDYVGAPLVTTAKINVSISAWFKTLNPNQAGQMVVHIGSDANGNGYGFAVNNEGDTNGTLRLLRAAIAWVDTGVRISDSNWHQVVMIVGPASEFTAYFDGTLVYGPTAGSLNAPTLRTDIGRNDYPAARYFNGSIDDVRIYNRVLSAIEVKALYENYE